MLAGLLERVRTPEFVTDVLQIAKCVIAATVAWWLSVNVLESQLPFLAPWTALLAVHATVYRSLTRGVQTTVATTIGVGLSFLVGGLIGVSVWTFALAVLVGLAGSRITGLRSEGIAIATTAVFVLGSGFGEQAPLLADRLIEVSVGVGVGVAVNVLFVPPLRDRQAERYVGSLNHRIGEVLIEMADELAGSWNSDRAEAWVAETESIDEEVAQGWQTMRFARESRKVNPRRYVPTSLRSARVRDRAAGEVEYEGILGRLDEGVSHLRHLARILRESTYAEAPWDEEFRHEWVPIVRDLGRRLQGDGDGDGDGDGEGESESDGIGERIDTLARRFSGPDGVPAGDLWPVYGALLTSVRHLLVIVDDVTLAREGTSGS
ncbi:FUSC family protein [Ruania alkalisoli]|uniref:FUSC family protein n=2 Tax=Ruania alkalisoli TaxID=2779775 RepID=A0A7M1T0Q4_9MICO|nr:FUSC family protein [Ruania alkalisoli]